ncbi:hypothetical protein ANO14919_023700 [Xylariales sp. No.14919]|nr:hypothetical protein ANO14919_023700 [Xylariales sp. No.14919]
MNAANHLRPAICDKNTLKQALARVRADRLLSAGVFLVGGTSCIPNTSFDQPSLKQKTVR